MMTTIGIEINDELVMNKLSGLVNQFYKILPIKESGECSLRKYMTSLQREMIGCKLLICELENDALYLTLLSILQYMIEYECDVQTVRSEVFKAISILKKLQNKFKASRG